MFKYLIKKQLSYIKTKSLNFSTGEGRKRPSLLDSIREKFTIKPKEKINHASLKNTDEKEDLYKASKLDDIEEEETSIIKMQGSLDKTTQLDIDNINTELKFEEEKTQEIKKKYENVSKFLLYQYKIKTENFGKEILELLNKSIVSDVESFCSGLSKLGFNEFQIKTLINKQ